MNSFNKANPQIPKITTEYLSDSDEKSEIHKDYDNNDTKYFKNDSDDENEDEKDNTDFERFEDYIGALIRLSQSFSYFTAKNIWPEDKWEPNPASPGEMSEHVFWNDFRESRSNILTFIAGLDPKNKKRLFRYMNKTYLP